MLFFCFRLCPDKMPSSARQGLPADMWQNNTRFGSSSPVSGPCPVVYDDLKPQRSPNRKKSKSSKRHALGKGYNNKSMTFHNQGLSLNTQDDLAYTEWMRTDNSIGNSSESASSSDSDSNTECSTRHVVFSGTFANDEESSVPNVADVPLPPMEWLKPSSKSPLTVGKSLHAMLMGL